MSGSLDPRAGRRPLVRQMPSDGQSTSSSALSLTSGSSSTVYTPPRYASSSQHPLLERSAASMQKVLSGVNAELEEQMIDTPDDEACYVDSGMESQIDFFDRLPEELATYIVSLLPHHRDVLACMLVSRRWYSLCFEKQIWKGLFESRLQDGWNLVGDLDRIWGAIADKTATPMADSDASREAAVDRLPRRSPRRPKRGCVRVDDDPFSDTSRLGDISMDSVRSDLTRASLQSPDAESSSLDWHAIYQARFQLTKRWSLHDAQQASTPSPFLAYSSQLASRQHNFTPTDKHLSGHTDSVYCVRFDNQPFTVPAETLQRLSADHRAGPLYDPKTSLGIGARGKILSGSRDQTIRIWDGDSGICLHTLIGHHGSVLCLEYDEEVLFSGSSDQMVIVWDLKVIKQGQTPSILKRIAGHSAGILDLAADDRWLITCGKDTTVRVYNRQQDCRLAHIYTQHFGPINAGTLGRDPIDGKTKAVTASGEGGVQLWDVESGELIRSFVGHSKGLACVKFTHDYIVTGSNDTTVRVWDAKTGDCLCVCVGHEDLVRAIGFDVQRKMVVSGGYDGKVKLFHLGEQLRADHLLADDDMQHSTASTKVQALWDIDAGHDARVFDVQMDVSRIICCGEDEKICVRDYAQGDILMRLFA